MLNPGNGLATPCEQPWGNMSNKLPQKRQESKPPGKKSTQAVDLTTVHNHFSGPIPPPDMLAQYERVVPGAAQIILQRAEYESTHRCNMEIAILHEQSAADIRKSIEVKRGQFLGISAVISVVLLAAYALRLGMENAAIGLGVADIAGLVYAFVKGRNK